MKKLVCFSVFALVMVLFLGAVLAEAQDVIRIGSIYPLTGAIASSGLRSKHAVENGNRGDQQQV